MTLSILKSDYKFDRKSRFSESFTFLKAEKYRAKTNVQKIPMKLKNKVKKNYISTPKMIKTWVSTLSKMQIFQAVIDKTNKSVYSLTQE